MNEEEAKDRASGFLLVFWGEAVIFTSHPVMIMARGVDSNSSSLLTGMQFGSTMGDYPMGGVLNQKLAGSFCQLFGITRTTHILTEQKWPRNSGDSVESVWAQRASSLSSSPLYQQGNRDQKGLKEVPSATQVDYNWGLTSTRVWWLIVFLDRMKN